MGKKKYPFRLYGRHDLELISLMSTREFNITKAVYCSLTAFCNGDIFRIKLPPERMNGVKEIGMPEARIILAEAVVYLAISTKSNSAYMAVNSAIEDIYLTSKTIIEEVEEEDIEEDDYYETEEDDDFYLYDTKKEFDFEEYQMSLRIPGRPEFEYD